jgi:peptidyl-prolyl cis-trans isomerase D
VLQQMRSAAKWIWFFIVACFIGGFLFVQTSGLLGREKLTSSTVVATVNGTDIPYLTWANLSSVMAQQQERGSGRGLTLDERRQIDDQAFEQIVTNILLRQEYDRRGITVSNDEVVQAAQLSPPPDLMQSPELQTDGRFDIDKYQRLLRSPAARQQGLLVQLENYYRTEIPKSKLFDQIAGDVYVTDAKLWADYRDLRDSALVSYVTFDPAGVPDSAVSVSDDEMRRYYDGAKSRFEKGGTATLSLLTIPRSVSAADSAAVRARALTLRDEIIKGAKFEDVAKRESADSASATQGGSLGMSGKNRFTPEFEKVAWALKPGEISQPVLTPFGYHLIKIDSRKGDSVLVRHILLRVQQSDSTATATDRIADALARIAASSTEPARFDSAARQLKLTPEVVQAFEGQPLLAGHGMVPSVSAWAFGGARPGETSEMFDSDEAYYIARLDTLREGGVRPFAEVKDEIRSTLLRKKKGESLVPRATELARAAAGSSLETAAKARDVSVSKSPMFSRGMFVQGLGRLNATIGAAFSLPIGAVSDPIVTEDNVAVIRVDRRVEADRAEWEKQKADQRQQVTSALRQARVRNYLDGLRKKANVKDKRKALNAAARTQAS